LQNNSKEDFEKYLSSLNEEDYYLVKYFLSSVADILVGRNELSAKETDYISQLKTYFSNQPNKKID